MDFAAWCDHALSIVIKAERNSPDIRLGGVSRAIVARALLGLSSTYRHEPWPDEAGEGLKDAILFATLNLSWLGFFDPPHNQFYLKVSQRGWEHAADPTPLWESICRKQLDADQQRLLRLVNRLSPREEPGFVTLRWVGRTELLTEWDGDPELLDPLSSDLSRFDLAQHQPSGVDNLALRPTYAGIVWESRRADVVDAKLIDGLVREWETTSVEFKRELRLDTADQKAEFVKDVSGLANTQASGRRWLVVGFDDQTRAYHSPPDPSVTQNRIEQVLARHLTPSLDVKYEVVPYKGGHVGRLEVLRDPKKLPYRVSKSLGDKKRIVEDQVFVRHGSQTEAPTATELQALREEAERAKSS